MTDLYWTYLQRPPDVMGLEFWVERIALQGRDGVREGFENSNEFAAHVGGVCSPGEPRGEVMWVMQDHQGSTRAMLNSAGQVVGRHDPLAFGDTAGEGNEVGPQAPEDETTGLHGWWNTVRHLYAGLERDAATGLEHATFRKYEPWAGRWTSPDPSLASMNPADPQSFNRYVYVQNDPVNFTDPSGLFMCAGHCYQTMSDSMLSFYWSHMFWSPGGGDGGGGDTGGGGGGGGADPQNPAATPPPCTFNVNISGVSGEQLTDMQNEMTRIFESGNLNVVFGQPGRANGGSMNLVVTGEFTGRLAVGLGNARHDIGQWGATIVGSGESQVNSSHIFATHGGGGGQRIRPGSFASFGTIYGRIGAHEVITHGFLPTTFDTFLPLDIRTPWTPKEGVSKFSGRFSMSDTTAADLRARCP